MPFYPFFGHFCYLQGAIIYAKANKKPKVVIQSVKSKMAARNGRPKVGNIVFLSRLSYQSKDKVTQLAKDGNK